MSCSQKHQFEGKVVLITGSSTGIGAGTALEFARQGASVSITGRNAEKLKEVARQCQEASPLNITPATTVGDITNLDVCRKLVENTLETFGKLDILVNNAGILDEFGKFEESSIESYDAIMNTNLRSVYVITQLCVPQLAKTKGNIVNVSSVASIMAHGGIIPYNMSKSALDHFTKCLAIELAPQGIRVNCVNPGPVKTDILRNLGPNMEEAIKQFTTPLGRIGEPQDIANIIAFLASDNASFATGVIFVVDGGFSLAAQNVQLQKTLVQ